MQHHQLSKQVQAVQVSHHLHPLFWLWNMDPACWFWKKGSRLSKPSVCGNFKINFLVGPQEPLSATVKRQKLAWFRHVTHHDSLKKKPSFRAPWRVGDAAVGSGNAGRTKSKSGHLCPCQNCSQGPPPEKTGTGSPLSHPSCPNRSWDWIEQNLKSGTETGHKKRPDLFIICLVPQLWMKSLLSLSASKRSWAVPTYKRCYQCLRDATQITRDTTMHRPESN